MALWESVALSFSRLVKGEPQNDSDGQPDDQFPAFCFVFVPVTIALFAFLIHRCSPRARREADLMNLPVTTYESDDHHSSPVADAGCSCSKEPASCSICLEELKGGQAVRVMPRCGHVFHRACIDKWLAVNSDFCPLCRQRVVSAAGTDTRLLCELLG